MTLTPLNGLQPYDETHGTGRPLVLLHGGLMTIDDNFGPLGFSLGGLVAYAVSRSRHRRWCTSSRDGQTSFGLFTGRRS